MRLLYLSESYVPSRRASSVHVMRMCQAFSGLGHEVTLVTKGNRERTERNVADDFEFYGVEPGFLIRKVPRPSFVGGGIVFTAGVWWYLRKEQRGIDVVYARDIPSAWAATRLGLPVIFEAHGVPSDGLAVDRYRRVISAGSFLRLVVISEGLRRDLERERLLPRDAEVVVAHDGAVPIVKGGVVRPIGDGGKFTAGYVGQLYRGKGMEVILPLAERMPDVDFHVVGGHTDDLRYWREQNPPPNVRFHGFVSPGEVGGFYKQFDVLLLPAQNEVYGASAQSEISRWMSPLKMFEYMATGKPIVCSNLPVLREVLIDEVNALLVGPDVIEEWEGAVRRLMCEPLLGERLGRRACEDFIEKYTWEARAEKVLHDIT